MKITRDIYIDELIEVLPASIDYLMQKGIRCIRCGEPIWGTLESACKEKEFSDEQIEIFVKELNDLDEDKSTQNIEQKIKVENIK